MHIKVLSVNLGYCYSESIIYIGLIIKRLAIHDGDFWWHCGNHDESVNESLFRKLVSYFSIRRNGGLLYHTSRLAEIIIHRVKFGNWVFW